MKKTTALSLSALLLALASGGSLQAARPLSAAMPPAAIGDSLTAPDGPDGIVFPEAMLADIDSILRQWSAQKFLHYPDECTPSEADPTFPDSVYAARLAQLPTIIPMPYNSVVRSYIDAYTRRNRRQVSYFLAAANFYIPIFEEALDMFGLPIELKYLPIVESALNPTAVSRVGATGLWQFMITTGQQYGLVCNSLLDERRDPIKSSYAAARYLRDLYHIFGDWALALAAYNCGPQNVNKAIRRAGGARDYWAIYSYLPRETRGYVPAFIAANYVMNYYCEHGISPMESDLSFKSDTVTVQRRLHLEQVAGACGLDIQALRALNPQYKADVLPATAAAPCALRLPEETLSAFIALGDSVYSYRAAEYASPTALATEASLATLAPDAAASSSTAKKKATTSRHTRYHRIRRGETLSTIAKRYGVTVSQLKRWNGMRSNRIRAGRRLKILK